MIRHHAELKAVIMLKLRAKHTRPLTLNIWVTHKCCREADCGCLWFLLAIGATVEDDCPIPEGLRLPGMAADARAPSSVSLIL